MALFTLPMVCQLCDDGIGACSCERQRGYESGFTPEQMAEIYAYFAKYPLALGSGDDVDDVMGI